MTELKSSQEAITLILREARLIGRRGGEIDDVVPGDVLEQQQAFNPGQTSKGLRYPRDLKLLRIPQVPPICIVSRGKHTVGILIY